MWLSLNTKKTADPEKLVCEVAVMIKFYVHEVADVNLPNIYFLKKRKENV